MKKSLVFGLLLFSVYLGFSQSSTMIIGRVMNDQGAPLVGASVFDPSCMRGTVSGKDGSFQIRRSESQESLKFSFIGYEDQVVALDQSDSEMLVTMHLSPLLKQEVVIEATRANEVTPMAVQNVTKEEIEALNLAQDMPILLNQSVSAVTTSDAGGGVGYTGLRIRGSDATRINVTVNGVPLNDPESHGVFWVNMPDFASSTQSIQIQRGVGSSTNGAAAFGATINLGTSEMDSTGFVEINNTYGSFQTRRHNLLYNSGLLYNHFQFEGRLSYIGSEGYIDRSAADLRSYFVSGGYFGERLMVKAVTFAGREVTQQAWYGTPASRIDGDQEAMLNHAVNNGYTEEQTANLLESGRTFNFYTYDNEIDNYGQDHYQLITGYAISEELYLNLTGHYTYGRGYFEQFKEDDDLSAYGLDYPVLGSDTIFSGDVIVRRWLRNHFYGGVYSLQYRSGPLQLTVGGSANEYLGDHFGEVIWSEFAPGSSIRDRYYESNSRKRDLSNYLKGEWTIDRLTFFADLQMRFIDYTSEGVDNDQRSIDIDAQYLFFNPKLGWNYRLSPGQRIYASVARASREPVRNDFVDATPGQTPSPEFLTDVEVGWNWSHEDVHVQLNGFYMHYTDQLVLTGELNDVGAPIRTNVPESYRAGLETSLSWQITSALKWSPNLSISQNKIAQFTELLYDYTEGFDIIEIEHQNTDIAFSPSLVGASQLSYAFPGNIEAVWLAKFVGRQYLDNTSNEQRIIDPYFVNDLRITFSPEIRGERYLTFSLLVNNLFDVEYVSNGYTYSYVYGDVITENFYYPQATRNFLAALKLRF